MVEAELMRKAVERVGRMPLKKFFKNLPVHTRDGVMVVTLNGVEHEVSDACEAAERTEVEKNEIAQPQDHVEQQPAGPGAAETAV